MKSHISLGRSGERIARRYFIDNGYRILECNWRFRRSEVDLIVKQDQWLVFCEVKTRTSLSFGPPEIFVTKRKKELLLDAAINYMQEHNHRGEFRFDIIAIFMKSHSEYRVNHFKDAFFPGIDGF